MDLSDLSLLVSEVAGSFPLISRTRERWASGAGARYSPSALADILVSEAAGPPVLPKVSLGPCSRRSIRGRLSVLGALVARSCC